MPRLADVLFIANIITNNTQVKLTIIFKSVLIETYKKKEPDQQTCVGRVNFYLNFKKKES